MKNQILSEPQHTAEVYKDYTLLTIVEIFCFFTLAVRAAKMQVQWLSVKIFFYSFKNLWDVIQTKSVSTKPK